jgi:hypothetical protein
MKPGTKPLSGRTMTHAERQARYRAKPVEGAPTFRDRKAADRRSRLQRWHDVVALRKICDLDPFKLEDVVPRRGFGRD